MVLCFTIVPTLALGHTWPNQMHTEGAIPGDKSVSTCRWPLLSSAKAKSRRSYKATPPYILMTWCISKHRPPPLHSTCTEQVEVHSVTTQHHAPQHNMLLLPTEANDRYINESILEWKHERAKSSAWDCKKVHYLIHSSYRKLFLHLWTSLPPTWKSTILDSREQLWSPQQGQYCSFLS